MHPKGFNFKKIFFLILKEAEKEEKRVNRRIEKKQKRFDSKQKGKKGPEKKDKSPQKNSGGESEKEENKKRKVGVGGLQRLIMSD